jgi:hypothetical protein
MAMASIRKIGVFLIVVAVWLAAAEVTARLYWRFRDNTGTDRHIPLHDAGLVLYSVYPRLREIDDTAPRHEDEFFDVLFLGGSSISREYGEVEQAFYEQFAFAGYRKNVRIFNLASAADTSRDSVLKYDAIGEARFELVIVYDGMNDARLNNAPPDVFRDDYGHLTYYEDVNALAPYHRRAFFALPYTLGQMAIRMKQLARKEQHPSGLREDWVPYGANPRSAKPFKGNMEHLVALAAERGDRLMLMTFAAYVPSDYSFQAFKDRRLDYGFRAFRPAPIDLIGRPRDVMATVGLHNEIVRGLAGEHRNVLFVDQAALMAGVSRYFNDPSHYTLAGASKFVEDVLAVLIPSLRSDRQSRASR